MGVNPPSDILIRKSELAFHFLFYIIRYINQTKPVKHSIDVSHTPDITQRFGAVNDRSHLSYIMKGKANRTPCQTLTLFPAVNP